MSSPPDSSYGIIERNVNSNNVDSAVEEVRCLGFSVFDVGFSSKQVQKIAGEFEALHLTYLDHFGREFLESRDEHNTIRLPLSLSSLFLDLATNKSLLEVVGRLVHGKFLLNQQNGIINPVGSRYNQDAWHRDLPYQHFVSSRPVIINALYCVDDFTLENGATFVLPASHKEEAFPSNEYAKKHAVQIIAPAGSFIILDGMLYHRGGKNKTCVVRRAVNHVYTIPHIKQQILIPSVVDGSDLNDSVKDLLGYRYQVPSTIEEFMATRPPAT